MTKQFSLLIISGLLFSASLSAQTSEVKMKREIGIRMPGFNITSFNFTCIYKKQKTEIKYRRVRFINANFNVQKFEGFKNDISLGIAIGKEYRKPLTDKFYWVKGIEFIGSIGEVNQNDFNASINPGVGLVFGFQYNFNEKFRASIETIPSAGINFNYTGQDEKFRVGSFNAGFNSNVVALSFLYAF